METLKLLEEKISSMVFLVKMLKDENDQLLRENMQLAEEVKLIKASALSETGHVRSLREEREQTRLAVDDLIKVIDSLVETQQ